jgi:isoleucyl-tRNA synthetase
VRQPLASLTIADPGSADLAAFVDLIADEVNVKQVFLTEDVAAVATSILQVVPAALGPRLGGQTQQVIKAVKAGDWHRDGDVVVAGGFPLEEGEYSLKLVATSDGASAALPDGRGVVVLDCALTRELIAEGVARDLVRLVQQQRRDGGFEVGDRIALTITASGRLRDQIRDHLDFVKGETLTTSLTWVDDVPATAEDGSVGLDLDGEPVTLHIDRA